MRAAFVTRSNVDDCFEFRGKNSDSSRPIGDKTQRAIVIAIEACWNWAADSVEDGRQLLSENHRPLAKLKRASTRPQRSTGVRVVLSDQPQCRRGRHHLAASTAALGRTRTEFSIKYLHIRALGIIRYAATYECANGDITASRMSFTLLRENTLVFELAATHFFVRTAHRRANHH